MTIERLDIKSIMQTLKFKSTRPIRKWCEANGVLMYPTNRVQVI